MGDSWEHPPHGRLSAKPSPCVPRFGCLTKTANEAPHSRYSGRRSCSREEAEKLVFSHMILCFLGKIMDNQYS
ncbi:hypothetical protein FP515_15045 [Geobacillus thermoleovorans]|uniref:Uncharacterized protein n=2 Tax=Geobacillus thermoleovorans group TaxID=1505648 RepID=A0A2Z3N857_GEOTH|nr:hypothetical protein CWI35_14255 [[Bacillus] caldolyticus]AWO75080.1 hypothetical protein C1N76_11620 [Geobacillus thermoleovorans]QCK83900.1 hypothetical protein E5Z46_17835 [Geobacillus kaustophilus NBRC 102445]TRY43796.1 hypothetical protein FOI67_06700 [Geobacillus sp. LEMMJ02]QDY74349.1 hypothetical protein FP515_15045 [Geobacillus thermoleovorans]